MANGASVTRRAQPIILVRGFGGLGVEDEKKNAYQGFNDGTVYPRKRGENYIFEGFVLRMLKSRWQYVDATNVVGYYGSPVSDKPALPAELGGFPAQFFSGDKIVIDPAMALHLLRTTEDVHRTLWVFRYYDLDERMYPVYGRALRRLIEFIGALAKKKNEKPPKVNIIAHSMGGLLVRHAVQVTYPEHGENAPDFVNKIATLGTPHQGISFQIVRDWLAIDAEQELERFSPTRQAQAKHADAYVNFHKHFPPSRLLTVVGTNYRAYAGFVGGLSSGLNRLFSRPGEGGWNYNRSDGLVKQSAAQLPGSPRTFVHKCHGGFDSLVTSREAYEAATRFFFGDVRVRLLMDHCNILRGQDWFGKSEFYLGVGIKPRGVDFDLFHQSAEAENCYGPFRTLDLTDRNTTRKRPVLFPWLNDDFTRRPIWEGWLDTEAIIATPGMAKDMVFRLDIYVGERDSFGIGFSDNVVFRKQVYVRAILKKPLELWRHTGEEFRDAAWQPQPGRDQHMPRNGSGWTFEVRDSGFEATFRIEIDTVPEEGEPKALT